MNLIRSSRWCSFRRGTRCTTTCPPGPGSCRQGRGCTMSRRPSSGSRCPRRMVSATWRPLLGRTSRPRHCSTTTCPRPAGTFLLGRGCIPSLRLKSASTPLRCSSCSDSSCPCLWCTGPPREGAPRLARVGLEGACWACGLAGCPDGIHVVARICGLTDRIAGTTRVCPIAALGLGRRPPCIDYVTGGCGDA